MNTLDALRKPIAAELNLFEQTFREAMKSQTPLLDRVTQYILKQKGKQMRPMFVLSVANLCGGITETTYRGAALVELLHTATLVHDDVVDDAYQRRGFFSINALWKNKIAVLVGDYLLAKGLLLSVNHADHRLLKIVSEAVQEMSEGELLQLEKARKLDIDEAIYFEVIRKKTASLIASCCACGAASAGADEQHIERMRLFGEKIGIAFQLKDDLFDFGTDQVGKPLGIDIKEKKMTLPLIYALQQSSRADKRRIIHIIKNKSDEPNQVQVVVDFVRQSGGLAYAQSQMLRYQEEAFELLKPYNHAEHRTHLENLVRFTTERTK